MTVRIEASKIEESDGKFNRIICILCDSDYIWTDIVSSERKEDLEVIDHENFQEAEDLDINRHENDSMNENEARELIINIEKDVEECEQCGKLCRKDPKYPTSTQISTSDGYFCCWGCLETYAADNQKTTVRFFENDHWDELSNKGGK